MKFVDELPESKGRGVASVLRRNRMVEEVRAQPGRWAEVCRSASSANPYSMRKRWTPLFPDLELVVRKDGEEYVLYARSAVTA